MKSIQLLQQEHQNATGQHKEFIGIEVDGWKMLHQENYIESNKYFNKALQLLETLEEKERPSRELSIQMGLAQTAIMHIGYSSPKVQAIYQRAMTLCDQVGTKEDQFLLYRGLWSHHLVMADLEKACEIGKQLCELASEKSAVEALMTQAIPLCYMGKWNEAQPVLQQIVDTHVPQIGHNTMEDPKIVSLCFLALAHTFADNFTQGLASAKEAVELAKQLNVYNEVFARLHLGGLYCFQRENEEKGLADLEQTISLAEKNKISHWLAIAKILRGYVLIKQGKDGVTIIEQQLKSLESNQAKLSKPLFLSYLAEGYRDKDKNKAITLVDEALFLVQKYKQFGYEVDLLLLKGELLPQQQDKQTNWQKALQIARQQNLKLLERRALSYLDVLKQ